MRTPAPTGKPPSWLLEDARAAKSLALCASRWPRATKARRMRLRTLACNWRKAASSIPVATRKINHTDVKTSEAQFREPQAKGRSLAKQAKRSFVSRRRKGQARQSAHACSGWSHNKVAVQTNSDSSYVGTEAVNEGDRTQVQAGENVVRQVRCGLGHSAHVARVADPTAFAGEGHQVVMPTVVTAGAPKAVGKDAALQILAKTKFRRSQKPSPRRVPGCGGRTGRRTGRRWPDQTRSRSL